jgi:hypothetical protein
MKRTLSRAVVAAADGKRGSPILDTVQQQCKVDDLEQKC